MPPGIDGHNISILDLAGSLKVVCSNFIPVLFITKIQNDAVTKEA